MSKLARTEANLHLPEHQPKEEELTHPRKTPEKKTTPEEKKKENESSTSATAEEGKDSPTGSRHPLGHKIKTQEEVEKSIRKGKFLPLSDGLNCGDIYYQPSVVLTGGKNVLSVMFEEFYDGDEVVKNMHEYSVSADDLLKMMYLAEKMQNTYYNMDTEEYDLWFVHKYAALVEEYRSLDMNDHGTIAEKLLMGNKDLFILGKGSFMEVYFQKHCVHKYPGAVSGVKNPNIILCKAMGRGKFEYIIEARVFVLSEEIHERKIGDMVQES